MKYDFESILDRRGQDALAVDYNVLTGEKGLDIPAGTDIIPMWVADMNFPVLPKIQEKIIERASHPAFGYFPIRDEYYDAIINWQTTRNKVSGLTRDCIGYENGVLGGVVSALNVLCSRGDNVLVHSPTYIGFTMCLENNGYNIVHSPLARDEDGVWRMDFADMEKKIVEKHIHAMVFCSPHNPCGRVWEKWELEKLCALCEKHDVKIVSDEIWSDIIRPGFCHTPTQSTNDWARQNVIALYAPSKTFNLAGLIGAYHIVYNTTLHDRMKKESSLCHYNDINVLSMHALMGAYTNEGQEWTDEMCAVIAKNVDWACEYISEHFDGVSVMRPQGTYMLFIDLTKWCEKTGKTLDWAFNAGVRCGVVWQDGRAFHGACHIRMNLALPLSRVQEAFYRLDKNVFNAD